MRVRKLEEEQPPLGKVVMLLVDGNWLCYLWQGDSWQRFDGRREPQPTDRWKPAPPSDGINYRQPT